MDDNERDIVENIVRTAFREEFSRAFAEQERKCQVLFGHQKCLVEESGVKLEEHKDHHKAIHKLLDDIGSMRKAFLMGVVTTITGGVLGLAWLWFKLKLE